MTASRHRRLAQLVVTHDVARRSANAHRAIGPRAPRVNARFCRSETAHRAPKPDVLRVQALSAQRDPCAPESAI